VGAYVGLSGELREYLTIWAIGTIIGVMKDVDMKFTREYDKAHFQVLVLDPSLIPHSIDVVIGEFIHELHFRVERGEMTNPTPIDMDDDTMEEQNEEGPGHGSNPKPSQQDQPAPGSSNQNNSARNSVAGSKQILHGKTLPMHIHAFEMVHDFVHGAENVGEEVASSGEAPNIDSSFPIMLDVLLAAIPEMESPGRSKHRAKSVDESSMERAERIKATRNLDFDGNTNHSQPSSLLFSMLMF
jgi:hypothetical protein